MFFDSNSDLLVSSEDLPADVHRFSATFLCLSARGYVPQRDQHGSQGPRENDDKPQSLEGSQHFC